MMKHVFQSVPSGSSSSLMHRLNAGVKHMNRKFMVVLAVALLLVPTVPLALATAILTVEINPTYYNAGDTVTISGTAPADADVEIDISNASDSVFFEEVAANSDGEYETSYEIPDDAAVGIYMITVAVNDETEDALFMVTTVSISDLAEQLIDSAEDSQELAEETIQAILDGNYTLPSAVNASMTQGKNAIEAAQGFYDDGLYRASAEAAQRAMVHFKNAMTLAIRAGKIEDTTTEDDNATLTEQVEKLTGDAERISEILENMADEEMNVTAIEDAVESAKDSLTSAAEHIENEEYEEAVADIKAARSSLHEAMQRLKTLLKDVRKGLMGQFKERLRARINATESDLDELDDCIQDQNMTSARRRLGNANGLLKHSEDKLAEGDDDDALDDLEEASEEFDEGLSDLDDDGYSNGMKNANQIRAQIQILEELASTMEEQGQDASAVYAKIEELQTLLDEGIDMMRNGNANGANDLFEDSQKGKHGNGSGNGGHGKGKDD